MSKLPTDARDWDGSWEANSRRLLETTLKATPEQRLAWLEEAIALAYEAGALPPRTPPDSEPDAGSSEP